MKNVVRAKEFYLFLVIVGLSILVTSVNRSYFTLENLFDLLKTYSVWGILASGVLLVLVSGGIDVSFGVVTTVAMYVMGEYLFASGGNFVTALLVSCAVGIGLGAINGLIIARLRIPTIITTLGTMAIFRGVLFLASGGKWIYQLPTWFVNFGDLKVLTLTNARGEKYGLPIQLVMWAVVMLMTWLILKYTVIGRGIYAMGGNPEAARRAGFNITFQQMFIYCYVGFVAGIASVAHVSILQHVDPKSFVGVELPVIAAVVLGGAAVTGGTGSVLGTMLGVVLVAITSNGLTLMRVSSFWQETIIGLILILSMTVGALQKKRIEGRRQQVDVDLGEKTSTLPVSGRADARRMQ